MIRDKRAALDIATIFRAVPWIMMLPDRDFRSLIKRASHDCKGFIEKGERHALIRGLLSTWTQVMGQEMNGDALNQIVDEVIKQVDEQLQDSYDTDLGGEPVDGSIIGTKKEGE